MHPCREVADALLTFFIVLCTRPLPPAGTECVSQNFAENLPGMWYNKTLFLHESFGDDYTMKQDNRNSLIPIGKMATANKVTIATLRLYDQMGLLKPAFIDPDSGYRYYTIQ